MLARMRRTAAISVLLASGGLLIGCGGTTRTASSQAKHTATSSKPATAAHPRSAEGKAGTGSQGGLGAAPGSPEEMAARARARKFAAAVNLRASDVRGFRASPKKEEHAAGERHLEQELLRCVGNAGAARGLAESGSGTFQRQASIISQTVSSEVTVARTPALAEKQLAEFHSGVLPRCLSHYFSGLLGSQRYHGAKLSPVTTKQGAPPAPGTTGSFGLRFTATVTLHSIPIPLYIDILGFVEGSAEVSMFATGIPKPVPAKIEEHLFTLLLARAKANKA
jgi:hypothetical protein